MLQKTNSILQSSFLLSYEEFLESYEGKLLTQVHIQGSIPQHILEEEGKALMKYDCRGLVSFSEYHRTNPLRLPSLQLFLRSLQRMLSQLEEYLLPESSLLLSPDYIFFDPENNTYLFTLYPRKQADFRQELHEFFATLLERVDPGSEEAILLCFLLYQESRRQSFSMEDLLRVLRVYKKKLKQRKQLSPSERNFLPSTQRSSSSHADSRPLPEDSDSTPVPAAKLPPEAEKPPVKRLADTKRQNVSETGRLSFSGTLPKISSGGMDLFQLLKTEGKGKKRLSRKKRAGKTETDSSADAIPSPVTAEKAKRKELSPIRKAFLCLITMLLIPVILYLWQGAGFFPELFPLLLILELGILSIAVIDFLLSQSSPAAESPAP